VGSNVTTAILIDLLLDSTGCLQFKKKKSYHGDMAELLPGIKRACLQEYWFISKINYWKKNISAEFLPGTKLGRFACIQWRMQYFDQGSL
jgi:hypothetical protein